MDDSGSVKGIILTGDRGVAGAAPWDAGPDLLLPMANKSLVERILGGYARAGVRETLIVAGKDTREISSRCGDGARWDMKLTYQDAADGQSCDGKSSYERVSEAAAFTKTAPFLVTTGPLLLESADYGNLIHSYRENHPCGIGVGRRAGNTSGDFERCSGIYLLTSRFYNALDKVKTCDDSAEALFEATLDELAARGETVLKRNLDHLPLDVRSPEAYLASNERLLAQGGVETDLPEIMSDNFSSPNLVLRPPVIVDATAELERCRIGPGVCIGPGVRIGHGAAIEHGVIMEGADIGDGASISHAVIGKNASIENRSVIHGRTDRVRVVRSR